MARMKKLNCWEFKNCGRHEGGDKVAELGICPAYSESKLDGVHGGTNGGRACWILKNTLCGGNLQSNLAVKLGQCVACEFYKSVMGVEEGALSTGELREMLK